MLFVSHISKRKQKDRKVKNYEISAWASVIIVVLGTAWYHKLLWQRTVKTIAATWIVATAAMVLNAITYWTTPGASMIGFALPAVSITTIGSILMAVLIYYSRIDGQKIVFLPFQKKCLVASAIILTVWIGIRVGGGTGKIPFFLTQVLMIISYSMLIKKYWKADFNNESLILWWSVGVSSAVAILTAHLKDVNMPWYDSMSWWYAIRSTGMCLILLPVLHRAAWRERNSLVETTYAEASESL
jgi:hypothetical protein